MLPKSSSQKTLRAAMMEERASATSTMASRLLSQDVAVSNPSFRVYYGVASAGSVPFLWESAPGTPKNDAISDAALPPLTPPPSYYNNKKGSAAKAKLAKSTSSKLLLSSSRQAASFVHSIIPKLRRSHTMPSPSSASASASSKEATAGDQVQCSARRKRLVASPRSSFSSTSRGEDDEGEVASPMSTLCFRTRHSTGGGGARRMHGLLASVVGGN